MLLGRSGTISDYSAIRTLSWVSSLLVSALSLRISWTSHPHCNWRTFNLMCLSMPWLQGSKWMSPGHADLLKVVKVIPCNFNLFTGTCCTQSLYLSHNGTNSNKDFPNCPEMYDDVFWTHAYGGPNVIESVKYLIYWNRIYGVSAIQSSPQEWSILQSLQWTLSCLQVTLGFSID